MDFPPSPPPPFRRIDFYCPPRPSLKPLKKEPFASYIYIEKGRPFWLLFASFFRLWKNVRAKSEAFRRVPQSSSFGSLCDLLILILPFCCSALCSLPLVSGCCVSGVVFWLCTKCARFGFGCAQVCTSVFRCAQVVHVCRFRLCTVCTVYGMP